MVADKSNTRHKVNLEKDRPTNAFGTIIFDASGVIFVHPFNINATSYGFIMAFKFYTVVHEYW